MNKKLKIIFYVVLITVLVGSYLFFKQVQNEYVSINSFEECINAGYKVISTYPEQCKIPGKTFTNTTQIASVNTQNTFAATTSKITSPKNATYDIEGQSVTLVNGEAKITEQIGDSTSTNVVKYFGNEVRFDFDNDGKEDSAFLLTTNNSGSGTFYYLVVALNKDAGYVGTNGVFIGDRIAPQTTEYTNNNIVVNYADRKLYEPMTTKPSVGISKYFKIINNTLVETQK